MLLLSKDAKIPYYYDRENTKKKKIRKTQEKKQQKKNKEIEINTGDVYCVD